LSFVEEKVLHLVVVVVLKILQGQLQVEDHLEVVLGDEVVHLMGVWVLFGMWVDLKDYLESKVVLWKPLM
jgi:hypothetical protein